MRIESIEIDNYRQYQHSRIEFTQPQDGKFVTAIVGMSGAGKTNILNAITWCLYGKELHLTDKEQLLPIYSIPAYLQSKDNSIFEVKVQIILRHDSGERYLVSRSQRFQKIPGQKGAVRFPSGANAPDGTHVSFMVERRRSDGFKQVDRPEIRAEYLVPEKLEQYFLFDGERIREFFKSDTARTAMKEEVYRLSQIDLLERAEKRLGIMRDDLKSAVSEDDEAFKTAKREMEDSKIRYDDEEKTLAGLGNEKNSYDQMITSLREELKSFSEENVASLKNQEETLERFIQSQEDTLDLKEKERSNILVLYAPAILAHQEIVSVGKLISLREEAGEIPAEYKRSFLEKIISKKTCICGEKLDDSAAGKKRVDSIHQLLERTNKISDMSETLTRFAGELRRIETEINRFWSTLEDRNNEISGINEKIKEYERDIEIIKDKLKGINVERVRQLQESEEEAKNKLKGVEDKIAVSRSRSNEFHQRYMEKDKDYREILEKTAEGKKIIDEIRLVEEALSLSKGVINDTVNEVRKEVSDLTNKYFFSYLAKETTFCEVKITQDYEVKVIHSLGWEARGSLSSGETQMLALAFFAALNQVSGLDVPIFIDAPLARISEAPTSNIVSTFPECFKNKQVCLLLLDKEYKDIRQDFAPIVGKEYFIEWTEIEKEFGKSEIVDFG